MLAPWRGTPSEIDMNRTTQHAPRQSALRTGRGLAPWILCLALVGGAFVLLGNGRDERPEPRPVVARGALTTHETATIDLFERVSPSVVHITTTALQRQGYWSRSVVEVPAGTGSGFLWDDDRHVVTNFHVVQSLVRVDQTGGFAPIPGRRAYVTLQDARMIAAEVLGVAAHKDLAVLRLEEDPEAEPLPIGTSADLRVGQSVFAIGNPFGLDQTLTTGVISGLGREIQALDRTPIRDVIQTDAAINPGNSGGPLLDSAGRLIGVNTAIVSPSGAYAGIGFAVPVDAVNRIVPELIRYGHAIRAGFGISTISLEWEQRLANRYGIRGALVGDVFPDSAAAGAGFRPWRVENDRILPGDVIVGVGQDPIRGQADLIQVLKKYDVGDEVRVVLQGPEEQREVGVVLQAIEQE